MIEIYEAANAAIDDESLDEAQEILEPLAQKGEAQAQFMLGNLYYLGADVSWEDALRWMELAAEQDHPEALYCLASTGFEAEVGEVAWRPPESEADCKRLVRAAELGSAQAQRDLGAFYCVGEGGFSEDEVQGRHWYLQAAEQGHIDAQYNLGMMLLEGEGGDVDVASGMEWLLTASQSDDDPAAQEAAELLSEIYADGLYEIKADRQKAKVYSQLARELAKLFEEE